MRVLIIGFAVICITLLYVYVQGLSLPTRAVAEIEPLRSGVCKQEALEAIRKHAPSLSRSLFFRDTEGRIGLRDTNDDTASAYQSDVWFFSLANEKKWFDGFEVGISYTLYFDDDCISSIWRHTFLLQK